MITAAAPAPDLATPPAAAVPHPAMGGAGRTRVLPITGNRYGVAIGDRIIGYVDSLAAGWSATRAENGDRSSTGLFPSLAAALRALASDTTSAAR